MDFWLDNINSEDLASDCGQESVVYVECLGREDDGPETQDGPGGPAGDLDQKQETTHLGHSCLVFCEGDGPPGCSLLLLNLVHTLQKQDQPDQNNLIMTRSQKHYLNCWQKDFGFKHSTFTLHRVGHVKIQSIILQIWVEVMLDTAGSKSKNQYYSILLRTRLKLINYGKYVWLAKYQSSLKPG